jgi:hypothetical protein
MRDGQPQTESNEWVAFPGGELEGIRPAARCRDCRDRLARETAGGEGHQRRAGAAEVLCFQCYRAGLARARAIKAAAELNTASEARFQELLPFEPVNVPRLEMLKLDRTAVREIGRQGTGRYENRRRHAQLEARRALQAIFSGVRERTLAASERERQIARAVEAAELQLPEAWLPFVVAR